MKVRSAVADRLQPGKRELRSDVLGGQCLPAGRNAAAFERVRGKKPDVGGDPLSADEAVHSGLAASRPARRTHQSEQCSGGS